MPPKRVKLECLICKATFDSDYRTIHNFKRHSNLMKQRKSIPYQTVGARMNPFDVSFYKNLLNKI
jgi:hypothetical protein